MPWPLLGRVGLGRGHEGQHRAHGVGLGRHAGDRPAEKVVMKSVPGGSGPSTSMPSRCISSLSCWKPSSTVAVGHQTADRHARRRRARCARAWPRRCPSARTGRQVGAAGPGGIADAARAPAPPAAARLGGRCRGAARRRAPPRPPASAPGRPGCRHAHGRRRSAGRCASDARITTSKASPAVTRLRGVDAADRFDRDRPARRAAVGLRPARPARARVAIDEMPVRVVVSGHSIPGNPGHSATGIVMSSCDRRLAVRPDRHDNPRMDLKQLDYFVHVAELASFTRASAVLRVAQPALSRQVRQLEVELRQSLFERTGRGVTLTDGRPAPAGARARHPAAGRPGAARHGGPARRARRPPRRWACRPASAGS